MAMLKCATAWVCRDSQVMQRALDTHDTVLRALLARYYGYEVTTEGDSFTMAFHDPVDAVHSLTSAVPGCQRHADVIVVVNAVCKLICLGVLCSCASRFPITVQDMLQLQSVRSPTCSAVLGHQLLEAYAHVRVSYLCIHVMKFPHFIIRIGILNLPVGHEAGVFNHW